MNVPSAKLEKLLISNYSFDLIWPNSCILVGLSVDIRQGGPVEDKENKAL